MKLFYTLAQALDHLKWKIKRYEKKQKAARSKWRKREYEDIIEWLFERGLNIIQYSKPGEVTPALIDWFLNRKKENPETKRVKKVIKDNVK